MTDVQFYIFWTVSKSFAGRGEYKKYIENLMKWGTLRHFPYLFVQSDERYQILPMFTNKQIDKAWKVPNFTNFEWFPDPSQGEERTGSKGIEINENSKKIVKLGTF